MLNQWLGLEIGSWSEWVSGILTALGIYIGLQEKKMKIRVKVRAARYFSDKGIGIEITNKCDYEIVLNGYRIYSKDIDFIKYTELNNFKLFPMATEIFYVSYSDIFKTRPIKKYMVECRCSIF